MGDRFEDLWRAAPVAELAWLDASGRPEVLPVVPLVDRDGPVVALTYDRLEAARSVADARAVVLAAVSPTGRGDRSPLSVPVRVALQEDPRGEAFEDTLLPQELAKHPPARQRADSPLLRREHWWYLPRLILRAVPLGQPATHVPRDGLAAVAQGSSLSVGTVAADGDGPPSLPPELPGGAAVVLLQGATTPHVDDWWWQRWRGRASGGRLTDAVVTAHGPARGVWRRWRAEVAFERACRAGLETAGL